MTDCEGNKLLVGDVVSLCGLTKANHLNAHCGLISSISELSSRGWVSVKLFPKRENKEVAVKPENVLKQQAMGPHGNTTCVNCHDFFPCGDLMCCSKCKLAVYCSRQCQREHWEKQHKQECKRMRQLRKGKKPATIFSKLGLHELIATTIQMAHQLEYKQDFVGSEKVLKDGITELESRGFVVGKLHELLGNVIGEQPGRLEEGIERMKRGIRLQVDNIGTQFDQGSCARFVGHNNLAILLSRMWELEESVEHYWKAYELDPSQFTLLCQIGKLYNTMGKYKKGEETCKMYLAKAAPFDKSKRPMQYEAAVVAYTEIGEMKSNTLWDKLNASQKGAFITPEWVQQQAEDIRTALHKALEMDPFEQYAKKLLVNLDSQLKP